MRVTNWHPLHSNPDTSQIDGCRRAQNWIHGEYWLRSPQCQINGRALDSWRILECILECKKAQTSPSYIAVVFQAECKQIKHALKHAVRMEKCPPGWYELDHEVAMEVFNTDLRLPHTQRENEKIEASSTSSTHSSSQTPNANLGFRFRCSKYSQTVTHTKSNLEIGGVTRVCGGVQGDDTLADDEIQLQPGNEELILQILRAI